MENQNKYQVINEYRKNFSNIFHRQVMPALKTLESERLKQRKIALAVSISCAAVIAVLLILIIGMQNSLAGIFFNIVMPIGAVFCIYQFFKKNFENNLKLKIMPILMPAFGNFRWSQSPLVNPVEIEQSKLFNSFDDMDTDDNFAGSYKDVPLRISETKLTYETRDSEGHKENHLVFGGVLISLNIPKNFTGHTIVKQRSLLNGGPYKEVKLEDPEFSKKFYVSSTDQVEARYLLTTAFMERYKNIQKAFNSNDICCSFLNNQLLIAVSVSKDLFSLGNLNKPLTDTTQYTLFLNEIVSIFELIEELKLYQKTGL